MSAQVKRYDQDYEAVILCIRLELKRHFPNTKFLVSGGCYAMEYGLAESVTIEYTNGAPETEVRKIVEKYEYCRLDSINNRYIPQVEYVYVTRIISRDVYLAAYYAAKKYIKLDVIQKTRHVDDNLPGENPFMRNPKSFLACHLARHDLTDGFRCDIFNQ